MDSRFRFGVLTLAGVLLLTVPGSLRAQEQASLPAGVTPAMVVQGKKVFSGKGLCVACHGDAGKGGLAPSLRDSTWIHSRGTYEDIMAQIRRGVPAESYATRLVMPPLGGAKLSESEVGAVAAYVWSLRLESGQ